MTTVLGIHIGHDGGAAICHDGAIKVACSEERLTRRKYANGWYYAVIYCLRACQVRLDEIDLVVFSNAGDPLPHRFTGGLDAFSTAPIRTANVDHHLSHAIGAYVFSKFESAAVLVCDAGGNNSVTESVFHVSSDGATLLTQSPRDRPRCAGLGTTYEAVTNYLGFADQESGKTMALAAYGEAPANMPPLVEVADGGFVTGHLPDTHHWGVAEFIRDHKLRFPEPFPDSRDPGAQALAAYVQSETEQALASLAEKAIAIAGCETFCLSGGVALNCVANGTLHRRFGDRFFPFGAGSDAGLAVGNALFGHLKLMGSLPKLSDVDLRLGSPYTSESLLRALSRHPDTVPPGRLRLGELRWDRVDDPTAIAADLLLDGKIIGWFQDRSELGPRALGSRSILALPSHDEVRERLNRQVKCREWFRPFGPSVLQQDAESIALDGTHQSMDQMVVAARIHPTSQLTACTHVDGTARMHTVHEDRGDRFATLLRLLRAFTGVGAVLNTSFNVQEPIVETPGDAIATFLRTRLDALILDDAVCLSDRSV